MKKFSIDIENNDRYENFRSKILENKKIRFFITSTSSVVTNKNFNLEIETQREGCFCSLQKTKNIPEFEVASHVTAKT